MPPKGQKAKSKAIVKSNPSKGQGKPKSHPVPPARALYSAPASVNELIPEFKLRHKQASTPDGIRFEHAEPVSHVGTSKGFTLGGEYSINPLNAKLFKTASIAARNYESYKFHNLEFVYIPSTTTSDHGQFMHCIQYDPVDQAPTDDFELLGKKTRDVAASWSPSRIRASLGDLHKSMPKLFLHPSTGLGEEVSGAEARFVYAGFYRWFTMGNFTDATELRGRIFVKYDVEFFTFNPPAPISAVVAWKPAQSATTSYTVASNTSAYPALPNPENPIGLLGAQGDIDTSTSWDSAIGTIRGAFDIAKQIWSAGKYATGLITSLAAAAASDMSKPSKISEDWDMLSERKTASKGVRPPGSEYDCSLNVLYHVPDTEDSHESRISLLKSVKKRRGLPPDAAGGVVIALYVYEVPPGASLPADWPVGANTGLTYVGSESTTWTYTDTGAFAPLLSTDFVVPSGKRYVTRWAITTDAAAGSSRVVSQWDTTWNVASQY